MFFNIEDRKVKFLVNKSGVEEMTLKDAESFCIDLLNEIDKVK